MERTHAQPTMYYARSRSRQLPVIWGLWGVFMGTLSWCVVAAVAFSGSDLPNAWLVSGVPSAMAAIGLWMVFRFWKRDVRIEVVNDIAQVFLRDRPFTVWGCDATGSIWMQGFSVTGEVDGRVVSLWVHPRSSGKRCYELVKAQASRHQLHQAERFKLTNRSKAAST